LTSYSIEKSGTGFVVKANGEDVLKTKTMRMANKVVAEVRAAEMKEKEDGDIPAQDVKHGLAVERLPGEDHKTGTVND
jgi:hypothetical protein